MATSSTKRFIVGNSYGHHDGAVAVIDRGGRILYAEHTERQTGVKHDHHRFISPEIKQYRDEAVEVHHERPFIKNIRRWFSGETNLSRPIADRYINHHWSHAAGAYFTRPWHYPIEPVCVVIDSIGEFDTASIWYQKVKVWQMCYPLSIGLFYSAVTKQLGLRPNRDEHVVMAMAAHGNVRPQLLQFYEDEFKKGCHNGIAPHLAFDYSREDQAATAQWFLEREVLKIMEIAREYSDYLCYSGGVALNVKANTIVHSMFRGTWIMPNPGDAGSALGCAAAVLDKKLKWATPYLGSDIHSEENPYEIARSILDDGAVGLLAGRGEFGPRALGNRSLLADPRVAPDVGNTPTQRTGEEIVRKIKGRRDICPLAPMIMEEHVEKYFTGPTSEYMSFLATANENVPSSVKAIDNTSRVQVVPSHSTQLHRKVLEEWYELTNCPMLINTSFNLQDQPMPAHRMSNSVHREFESKHGIRVY